MRTVNKMRCKDCPCNIKGFFKCKPYAYVCTGVKEPFVIEDLNVECTEYPEMREEKRYVVNTGGIITEPKIVEPYIGDDGIYIPNTYGNNVYYQCVVPKELFVEAYNKWIKNNSYGFIGHDDADDWSED